MTDVPLIVFNITDPRDALNTLPGLIGMNVFADRDLIINPEPGNSYLGLSDPILPEFTWVSGELAGRTELFITPGFEFRVVDALMTNFHMPRSTLLVMIEAFAGPRWREWYRTALAEGYRFLSFGDAMFLEREQRQ